VLAVTFYVLVLGNELVQVVKALVVARVGHYVPGLGHDHVCALVLEAPQHGVLLGGRRGIERINLDDPAEAVGLVLVSGVVGVEARVIEFPLACGGRVGEAVPLVGGRGSGRNEVALEILLAGQDGAPRRGAAGAVAQRAVDPAAGRVGRSLDQRGPGGGSGELVAGAVEVAAVQRRALHVSPRSVLVLALQLDHGQPVRRLADGADLGGGHRRREHDGVVCVLVVGEEHRTAALATGDFEDVRVVIVVAELALLRRGSLRIEVERRGALEDRVAPPDERPPREAGGHGHRIDVSGDRGDGGEPQLGGAGMAVAILRSGRKACPAVGYCRFGGGQGTAEDDGEGTGGAEAQGGAAGQRGGRDVAEVAVGAGVAYLARAGVVALERAGDGAALAFGVAEHGQQGKLAPGNFRHGGTFQGM
jgi:hypothetical protein